MAATPATVDHGRRVGEFPYDAYMLREEIPLHRATIGMSDVTALARAPWKRNGCNGAFIELQSTFEAERGMYVVDIPAGGETNPEKHLYEEEIFILSGQGVTQVWQEDAKPITFEWGRGSVFAIPPNTTHFLANTTNEPVIYMGITTTPRVMDSLYDDAIVFNSDYRFVDLMSNSDNYFLEPEVRGMKGWYKHGTLATHFIPNAHELVIDNDELGNKIQGGQITSYVMGPRFPRGHVSAWPTGRYHKAHYHGAGAVLLGLDGIGYALAWDADLGARPYQNGHGDEVYRVEWGENSIYAPPNHWFHQHFNTGPGPARHIAVHAEHFPLGVHNLVEEDGESIRLHRSFKEGGTLIDYEDEDPQVRNDFAAELAQNNLKCLMDEVIYSE